MRRLSLSLSLVLLAAACSDNNNGGGTSSGGSGGARSGGSSGSGGNRSGGSTGSGGSTASGGSTGSGGSTATGGTSGGSGGTTATGGTSGGTGGSSGDAGGDTTTGDTGGDTSTPSGGNVFVYAASNTGYGTPTTIRAFKFDTTTGALTAGPTVAGGNNAAYMGFSPDRKFAYVLNEATMTTLSSYSVNQTTGALTKINSVMALADAVHLSVDPSGKYLATAHYTAADVTIHQLMPNGAIGMLSDMKKAAPAGMQRAHHTLFDKSGGNLFVSSLDAGHFAQFKFAAGKLTANEPYVAVGSEVRHLVIDQAEKYAYAVSEKEVTVVTFNYDKATGKLSNPMSMDASVNEKGGGSTVALHPNGKFLYVGSRFDNSIVTFAVDATTGKLTRGKDTKDSLSYPREFAIDPTGTFLIAGTQPNTPTGGTVPANRMPNGGGYVVVFKIDANDGSLTKVGTPMRFDTNVPYVGVVKMP